MEREDRPRKNEFLTNKMEIYFDKDDRENVLDPHYDGLVITLCMAIHFVQRILIDGGNSVNIILLETLNKVSVPYLEIIQRPQSLLYSVERRKTLSDKLSYQYT